MSYNLTEGQKQALKRIVGEVRTQNLPETFSVHWVFRGPPLLVFSKSQADQPEFFHHEQKGMDIDQGQLDALAEQGLLIQAIQLNPENGIEQARRCTLTALAYRAVDTDFAAETRGMSFAAPSYPQPPEIVISLNRLREKFPDQGKFGFLIMRFSTVKPFPQLVSVIKETASKYGLTVLRADEIEFHADLWGNVRTYLHGCAFGIAIYERVETEEPNANIGLEVGYLLAMNKPVLLLKDRTLPVLQSDLAGKLYKTFDPHNPEGTIPEQLAKWLSDNGIIVPHHPA